VDVAVLCGGVGAARFLRGLVDVVEPESVAAIVNTGDDTELHGLWISPDIDTIVYTLAGAIDPERGWGLRDDTWHALGALARYTTVRPPDSSAAPTWFNLGDQDLATHFYRTARRREGATLVEVTDEVRRAWGVAVRVIPMADEPQATMVTLATGGAPITFQDYFVRLRHDVAVGGIDFVGEAHLAVAARDALEQARTVVIAPSNPIVSIGPMRALPGLDELLAGRRESVVAVSPIVGGAALKGPADRMLTELGHEPSVAGIARLYAPIADALVIDPVDADAADAVAAEGMRPVVVESVMSTPARAAALASATLAATR
jgi:LPPG:FO 2-phospho-L-lactate transferase